MKKILPLILFISSLTAIKPAFSEEKFLPIPFVHLDSLFSHHVLIAEKSTHKLHLYENSDSFPRLIKTYTMATGKKAGDKSFQGDHRTPEGVYHFTSFITHDELIKKYGKEGEKYGIGSFVMNYPNIIDSRAKKTGGGIWLHSTNDETRIEKGLDSRGCVVIANNDLKNISRYIELNNTKIIVVHNLKFLAKTAWMAERESILSLIKDWSDAWKTEDFKKYISFYHKKNFNDKSRGKITQFSNYKRAVFAAPGVPEITITNISAVTNQDYVMVSFKQNYKSKKINDIGIKTLYLEKNEFYQWKIVSEKWRKAKTEERQVAFQPSMRFFKPDDVKESKN